tara:strand:- start:1391 stop:2146 length:756 start_codon:yes stop_codon:yes gene_type:complete
MRYSVIILFFGILSAQWTGGSANLIESGRKEIGLFSPIYVGLNNGKELSINKFLLMPSIALKQERSSIGQWQMAQKLQLEYPTIGLKWLQSPLGKELGDPNMFALISPQFNVPQMISAYGELIGTRGTEKIGRVTIRGGIAFSLGEKMSEDGTIDLPIIYPRLSVYYNGVAIKVGGEYYRRSKTQWSYLIDYDMFVMPGGRGRYSFEHKGMVVWSKSEKFRILSGYKLIAGEYPFGSQAHLLPAFDIQFGW